MEPELTLEFVQSCASRGIRFYTMYGQTEATARISFLDPDYTSEKIGSIGKCIPGGKLELVELHQSTDFDSETIGELLYSGPNVMMGYAGNRLDLSKGDELKGQLRTGDIATVDNDGFYYIVGRIKRFLKVYGKRINLDEVEALLSMQYGSVACLGFDDNLVIISEGNHQISDIKRYACRKFRLNHLGVRIIQIAGFPRLSNGKIDYKELEVMIFER